MKVLLKSWIDKVRGTTPFSSSTTPWFHALMSLLMILVTLGSFSARAEHDLSDYPWIYRRVDAWMGTDPGVVELIMVGDVLLGRGVGLEADPFSAVSPWLREADLTFGNLEGVLSSTPGSPMDLERKDPKDPIRLLMPYAAADELVKAGFDLLSMANNHAMDGGEAGLQETRARLLGAGVRVIGVGPTQDEAWTPVYLQIRGVKLAFFGINAIPVPGEAIEGWGPAQWNRERALQAVGEAANKADVVVVSIHWGYENQRMIDPMQRKIAAELLASGTDLLVGHHPHVIQGTQITPNGGFVAYSLGNFVFDQAGAGTELGLALRVRIDREGIVAIQALPVGAGPQPELLDTWEAEQLLAEVKPEGLRVGFRFSDGAWEPIEAPDTGPEGFFTSGAIDLTGDGHPERILLFGGRVTIEQMGKRVWESPPDWDVLDLALGDPNDDGRFEIMLAMNKPDAKGVIRSHPFIVGHRGGGYRTVWGGSAVRNAILEVALYDVDGDSTEELIVLERTAESGQTAISVWAWNGWGFSQSWRSPEGYYRDLQVADGRGGIVSVSIDKLTGSKIR